MTENRKWIRLQGADFARMKYKLKAYAYKVTDNGNICVYYFGGYKHFLNDEEKATFSPEGLKRRYSKPRKERRV